MIISSTAAFVLSIAATIRSSSLTKPTITALVLGILTSNYWMPVANARSFDECYMECQKLQANIWDRDSLVNTQACTAGCVARYAACKLFEKISPNGFMANLFCSGV